MGNETSAVPKPIEINAQSLPQLQADATSGATLATESSVGWSTKANGSRLHLHVQSPTPSNSKMPRLASRMTISARSLVELSEVVDIGAESPSTARLQSPDPPPAPSNPQHTRHTGRPMANTHHQTKSSSLLSVVNGITGTHISYRICKIATVFWKENIENLPMEQQLEIGCAIFFGAMSANAAMKQIMKVNLINNKKNIEENSLKFLDMMGYLLRHLIQDNIDLYDILVKLGKFHQRMGIKMEHFAPMLDSLHESLSYYFPSKYSIDVKYSMDEIFGLAAQLMTGQDLKNASKLNEIHKSFSDAKEIEFLRNLHQCLASTIGREYLYSYLKQTWCEEIVLFLQTVSKFKKAFTPIQRFRLARQIDKVSIRPQADFALNISYECRQNAMKAMRELEKEFASKAPLQIDADLFIQVEQETYRLIHDNHWYLFVDQIKTLQSKSMGR